MTDHDELKWTAQWLRGLADREAWPALAVTLRGITCDDCLRSLVVVLVGGEPFHRHAKAEDVEHVSGAAAAVRALRARPFGLRLLAGQLEADPVQNSQYLIDAAEAGVDEADIFGAAEEFRRTHRLEDMAPADALNIVCEELRIYQLPEPDGPGPDAEDYRCGTVDDAPDDGIGWMT